MSTAKQDYDKILKWEQRIASQQSVLSTPNLMSIEYMAANAIIKMANGVLSKLRVEMSEKIGKNNAV